VRRVSPRTALWVAAAALTAVLLVFGVVKWRESRRPHGFAARFALVRRGMPQARVRRLLGPPAHADRQPAFAVAFDVRRRPRVGLLGSVTSWYYGGRPDDPRIDLYVVDFDGRRVFDAVHVGRGA
jgi:hypothetical protein